MSERKLLFFFFLFKKNINILRVGNFFTHCLSKKNITFNKFYIKDDKKTKSFLKMRESFETKKKKKTKSKHNIFCIDFSPNYWHDLF